MENNLDLSIKRLGPCRVQTPLKLSKVHGDGIYDYISDDERVLFKPSLKAVKEAMESGVEPLSFEKAGPKETLYFEPAKTKVAIVTCGGLCPGLNNVIRGIVNQLYNRYNVTNILGMKYGYEGLSGKFNHGYVELDPEIVDDIHKNGGTVLGSSRGLQNIGDMVDTLEKLNINILFCVGGDGTLQGAHAIYEEIEKRNLKISIAGIPKTVDNDISFIDRSFGFETAFAQARDILINAHYEAKGANHGVALVKLMGRDSGFIAANAALAVPDVNFVIIPEMDFDLYGPNGFLSVLKDRLARRKHALVIVAEGAGQFLFEEENDNKDKSGNRRYNDIGVFLKDKIAEVFAEDNFEVTVKYIDPSYIIRSTPANANDSKFCSQLAQNAVHASMSGHTDFVVGYWNSQFTLLPIPVATSKRKKVNLESELWWNVLESTGQPMMMKNKDTVIR